MGTTANYSWPTPVATDLVKDGWDAIKDLGDAADTTVKAVADGRGLVHINTTSFSAVASQSLDNVFSSTYDNYRILLDINTFSADALVRLRLRVGGVDAATAYNAALSGIRVDGTAFSENNNNVTTGIFLTTGDSGTTDIYGYTGDIMYPFLANKTRFYGVSASSTSAGIIAGLSGIGVHTTATSYDGISLIASAGNITGKISIYGYKK